MTYQRNETPEPLASATTTTEAFETGLRAEFEAWKRTKNDGYDAWSAVLWATERAAKLCEELGDGLSRQWRASHKTNSHLEGQSDGCFDCAAAIRASSGKGDCDV